MVDEETTRILQGIAATIDEFLNNKKKPRKWGFALLIFSFNNLPEAGRMNWVSNADRADMIVALKEMVAQLEGRLGGSGHG